MFKNVLDDNKIICGCLNSSSVQDLEIELKNPNMDYINAIELRADFVALNSLDTFIDTVSKMIDYIKETFSDKLLILTLRTSKNGGKLELDDESYTDFIEKFNNYELVDLLDLEVDYVNLFNELNRDKILLSSHIEDIDSIKTCLDKFSSFSANMYKLGVKLDSKDEFEKALALIEGFDKPISFIPIGNNVSVFRRDILSSYSNIIYTYVSEKIADGQFSAMAFSDNAIYIKDLVFYYRNEEEQENKDEDKELNLEEKKILDNISLNVKKGEFTAILGENGSGKSTLAKHINGLLLPESGAVVVSGIDTIDSEMIWEIRENTGMVFQNPDNQLVSTIVEDDIAFGPENLGVESSEIRVRVDDALKQVDMSEYVTQPVHFLSGGQKQRIAIAGILAMKPKVIIFDEPTAMLDPKGRKEVMNIISSLKKQGITIVLITHFMEEALESDYIYVLSKGKIALEGKPEEVFSRGRELEALSLAIPFEIKLKEALIEKGFRLKDATLTFEDIKEELCLLK